MSSTTQPQTQSHEFKAEVRQLLEILTHSIYTSKDVFLRELISNAADALEKARFLQVSGASVHSPELPLEIRIETNQEGDAKVLIIADTGVGMTQDEVHANIGTIARSGATAFLEQLRTAGKAGEQQNLSLIGRFGVGFYSVFMAADKVVLTTRAAQQDARPVMWTSDGLGSYQVETLDADIPRGTRIEIHLRKSEDRFVEEPVVKSAIKQYSNFVPFPILVNGQRVNQATALWREPASQISAEQYNEFYKLLSHDSEDPIARLHFSADAPLQYAALLFVPASNFEALGFGPGESSLQLYVKRVMIDSENHNLLPKYLRFVKGVVESDDLPLNISRETLQENRLVAKIRESLTRKLLDLLVDLAREKPEAYQRFWKTFGPIFKEGYSDFGNREKFQDLLRFNSSRHSDGTGLVSLAEYVEAMPVGRSAIYYLTGASREALLRDPRLELFRKNGIEVLYLSELSDEFVLANLGRYEDKPLTSADQAKPDDLKNLDPQAKEDEKKASKELPASDVQPLIERFKEILGDRVIDVRASERLVDSPACLVSDDQQLSGHMEKVMRLINKSAELPRRIMEVNPRHPLIEKLARIVAVDSRDPLVQLASEQLFEGCMLIDGYLTDPHRLVERMNEVLDTAASLKARD